MMPHRVEHQEPICTAPRDPGREIIVMWRHHRVAVYWWKHWTMSEGVWWSNLYGAIDPLRWIP